MGFSIWPEMYGNGAKMDLTYITTKIRRKVIHWVQASKKLYVAAVFLTSIQIYLGVLFAMVLMLEPGKCTVDFVVSNPNSNCYHSKKSS